MARIDQEGNAARGRVFGLDLLRALAVSGVLLLHARECASGMPLLVDQLCIMGWQGVELFFVLSGFLIASQVLDENSNLSFWKNVTHFWIRRWTRTLPLYFVVFFAYAVLKPVLFHAPFVGLNWRYIFFLQNSLVLTDFAQTWSLCIEEQFYLVFPVLFFFWRPQKAYFWLLPWLASILYRIGVCLWLAKHNGYPWRLDMPEHEHLFRFFTPAHLDSICMGIILAYTRPAWLAWSSRLKTGILVMAVATAVWIQARWSYTPEDYDVVALFPLLALAYAGVLVALHNIPAPRGFMRLAVEKLALWSYGAYLWNSLFIRLFVHFPLGLHWSLIFALFCGLSLLVAWVTYRLVEVPGMALRHYLLPLRK